MTFAMPFFAWIAAGVAAATVALHLLAWRRPPETPLPTARFAPERPVRLVSRAVRPADLALMALRVVIVLLVGFALAGPTLAPHREGVGRVVVADRSNTAAPGAIADAVRAQFRAGDALVVFDSSAREVVSPSADSVTRDNVVARGSVSPALIAAIRAARRLERERDSVEIVVVSAFAGHELDAATRSIRQTWPGPVRVVRVAATPNDSAAAPARVEVRAPDGDPVSVALGLVGAVAGGASVRVVRDALTSADSAFARSGNAVVLWPAARAAGFGGRLQSDTAYGVTALGGEGSATVVAPFVRTTTPPVGRVVARWSDGEVAVTDGALGSGCVRGVAVPVPSVGDLSLSPAFRRFAARMASPCAGAVAMPALSDSALAVILPVSLTDSVRTAVAAVSSPAPVTKLGAWMLALALVAALAEMWLRRGGADATR